MKTEIGRIKRPEDMTVDERIQDIFETLFDSTVSENDKSRLTWRIRQHMLFAIEAERKACAKIADNADKSTHPAEIADQIRARGKA